jgi:spore germination protein GerM
MQRSYRKRSSGTGERFRLVATVLWLTAVVTLLAGCAGAASGGRQVKLSFVRALAQDIELVEVSRTVSADGPVVEAVLEELLKGPTPAERHQGLTTLIPEGTVVKSVSVDLDGTVHADFNEALQEGVGGSMWVMGIRRQIQASLLWIPGVTSVILSIEGRTEEILQP